MSGWKLSNEAVSVVIDSLGGQLGPVRFRSGESWLEPMHRAPWREEPQAASEPMLQNLQGDFFCAPFGQSDHLPSETRGHGLTANGVWRELEATPKRVLLAAEGEVSGAAVTKEVTIRPGQPVVYQVHRFEGGEGSLPLGHHAMLRAPDNDTLALSFSAYEWAGTPPFPLEPDPTKGRSRLRYDRRSDDLTRVETVEEGVVDLTSFPVLEDCEDLLMLISERTLDVAWSAAVAAKSGWIWFSLRPNTVLRNTVIWLSNGGRFYPPFSRRHRRVIGIEETTSYFHLGHRASVERNELNRLGYPTCVELEPKGVVTSRYAFGAVAAPAGFERVNSVTVESGRLRIADVSGRTVEVPFDAAFLAVPDE